MRRQRGGQKKLDPSWLATRPARCAASHHTRPEIRNPPIVRTTHSGFGLCRLCTYETTAEITGSSTGATRQAEIDQHPQELVMRRISDNTRLSNTVSKAGVRE